MSSARPVSFLPYTHMTLQHIAAQALVDQVRSATRGRNFLVWFEDGANSRSAGLPAPTQVLPPALKRLLLKLNLNAHQVVHGSSNPFIQHIMPSLLAMGVCLVKHSPTATTRSTTQREENEKNRAHRNRLLRYMHSQQEVERFVRNGRNYHSGTKPPKRRRTRAVLKPGG